MKRVNLFLVHVISSTGVNLTQLISNALCLALFGTKPVVSVSSAQNSKVLGEPSNTAGA
jgi:hypothetical protein